MIYIHTSCPPSQERLTVSQDSHRLEGATMVWRIRSLEEAACEQLICIAIENVPPERSIKTQ